MGIVHFLNVNEGDCHVIQHPTGHTTVIDVCNASATEEKSVAEATEYSAKSLGVSGNFNQKASPTNPISYLKEKSIASIFRYIQSHPDMDHMDGIRDLFEEFSPANFWDTNNTKEIDGDFGKYKEDDWKFYSGLRAGSESHPKRLALYDGAASPYFNQDENGAGGGDGLHILAPTKELVASANAAEDWNDSSYVLLYRTKEKKILFPGDAHDDTWTHLLENHAALLTDIDVLIAPHHGRDSSMDFSFLDTLKPTLTLFGNAKSKHLAYDKWTNRNLQYVTNNQAGNVILDPDQDQFLRAYVSNFSFAKAYAETVGTETQYSAKHDAWSLMAI
jgi:beta-lactamase superfamily II metal-dependent hydrolase